MTIWYVVIECQRSNHKVFPYNDYRGIVAMTTDKEEALEKEKEIDAKKGMIGIVEIVKVYNS